ncbi:MAG: DEAD/DEAH box helicase, partial [Chloroflexota bacterium]|nr:DEAD/DEAH box helicase [Chloroflexota bacterium]
MAAVVAAPGTSPRTRLAGLALVCSAARHAPKRFAAVSFGADRPSLAIEGTHTSPSLRALLLAGPVITDAPLALAELRAAAGLEPPAAVWDLLELAGLLLPDSANTSLDHVGAFLGLDPPDDDSLLQRAHLAVRVFWALVQRIEALDAATLLQAIRLASGLDWPLTALLREVERQRARSTLEATALANATPIGAWITEGAPPAGRRRPHMEPDPDAAPLDLTDIARRFAVDSNLARALASYEPRHEQVRMAQIVAHTLNGGGQVLVEAGTGTGKSLAYLLPAALRAVHGQRRVVVSTATTTLQDQLFEQDLPLVQVALSAARLQACVLKGRTNYLCLRRWQTLLHSPDLSLHQRTLLLKTLFWLPRTRTGDRAELRLTPGEEEAWSQLSAVSEACTPSRCSYHRIGVCFLARARRAAEESHVVITNHALLLTDLVMRSRVLPEYQVLVVDEAHHLEDEATTQLGWQLGERELISRLERLWSPAVGSASGLGPEALGVIGAAGGQQLSQDLLEHGRRGEQAVLQLASRTRLLFEGLARLIEDPELGATADESTLRVNAAIRAGAAWQELEGIWAEALEHAHGLERVLAEVSGHLQGLAGAPEAARDLAAELDAQLDYWRDIRRRLNGALHAPDRSAVYWIGLAGRARAATLNAAPLEVAGLLRERLFGPPEASVLVSATLAIGGSFDYVKQRLGLPEAHSVALGTSFEYARAALLYVPNDLPDPTQPGYQNMLERAVLDVASRLHGRTLVLFTSRAQLRNTYQAVRDQLAARHIRLLGQGIDESSRTRLLEAFRRGARVVLFGTNAFWEGIDVVGEALSCVIVARLPFAVPTDPVNSARAEQFDEPFMHYSVPQAVLRLKQGFGRL